MKKIIRIFLLVSTVVIGQATLTAQDIGIVGVTDEETHLSYSLLLRDMMENYLNEYQPEYSGTVKLVAHPARVARAINVTIKDFPITYEWAGGAKAMVTVYGEGKKLASREQFFNDVDGDKIKDWQAKLATVEHGEAEYYRIETLQAGSPLAKTGLKVGDTFSVDYTTTGSPKAILSFTNKKGKMVQKKIRLRLRNTMNVSRPMKYSQIENQLVRALCYAVAVWFKTQLSEKAASDLVPISDEPLSKVYNLQASKVNKTSREILPTVDKIPYIEKDYPSGLPRSSRLFSTGGVSTYEMDSNFFSEEGKTDYVNYLCYYHNNLSYFARRNGARTNLTDAVNKLSFPVYRRFEVGVIKYISGVEFRQQRQFETAGSQFEQAFISARNVKVFPQVYIAELQKKSMLEKSRCSKALGMEQLAKLEEYLATLFQVYERMQSEQEVEKYRSGIAELVENLDETDNTIRQKKRQAFWGTLGDIALLSVATASAVDGNTFLEDAATSAFIDGSASRMEARMAMDDYLDKLGSGVDYSALYGMDVEEEFNRLLFTTSLVRLLYTTPEPDFLMDRYMEQMEEASGTKLYELLKRIDTEDLDANQELFASIAKLEKVIFLYEQLGKEVPAEYKF